VDENTPGREALELEKLVGKIPSDSLEGEPTPLVRQLLQTSVDD
jgi:hypothetical protein